jgi:hypothetical protein
MITTTTKRQHGRLQGDSLSPLLFCISFNYLTGQMNMVSTGYEEHTKKIQKYHIYFTWMTSG